MALLEDMKLLNHVELLSSLGEEKLRLIAFGAERRHFQPGQSLFREDSPADCAFVIANGNVELTQRTRDGLKTLATVSTGTMLGELALISAVNRSMTAIAVDDVEVMRINRPLFHRLLVEYPEIADTIRERITGNLDKMAQDMDGLGSYFSK